MAATEWQAPEVESDRGGSVLMLHAAQDVVVADIAGHSNHPSSGNHHYIAIFDCLEAQMWFTVSIINNSATSSARGRPVSRV
jgi:hypothetical protein